MSFAYVTGARSKLGRIGTAINLVSACSTNQGLGANAINGSFSAANADPVNARFGRLIRAAVKSKFSKNPLFLWWERDQGRE